MDLNKLNTMIQLLQGHIRNSNDNTNRNVPDNMANSSKRNSLCNLTLINLIQSDDAIDLQQAQYEREMDEHTALVATNKLQLDKLSTQLEEATIEHNKPTALEALGGVTEKTWTSIM